MIILPVILIIVSIHCKLSVGEYYIGGFYDPAYAYLMNSLNLSQFSGYGVGLIEHPGTPVQSAGAIVIKIVYSFGGNNSDIATDVLSRPEFYLSRINLAFIIITGITLYLLGLFSYKNSGDIFTSVLLQLTPFYPTTVFDHFTDVSSESLFIVAVLLLITVSFCFVNEKNFSRQIIQRYLILFALVCGFGLACKIIFLPLLVIPLLLIKRISYKLILVLFILISFLIFVYPALSVENSSKYVNWMTEVFTHSGKYGTGEEGIVDSSSYFDNLIKLFSYDVSFNVAYAVIFITLMLAFFTTFKNKIRTNKYFTLLAGIFFSMTFQIIIVSKHFDPRYMIPAYLLCVSGLLTAGFIMKEVFPEFIKNNWLIYLSVVIISFSCYRFYNIFEEYSDYSIKRQETEKVNNFLEENYKELPLIKSTLINNKEYSLYFGTNWSGTQKERYRTMLKNLYPDYFYYDRYAKDFVLTDKNNLKKILMNSNMLIYLSDDESLNPEFTEKLKKLTNKENISVKKTYTSVNNESLYEVTLKP